VHDAEYVDSMLEGHASRQVERAIGLPITASVGRRGARATGGTLLAAELALQNGIVCNTAGGSHHAKRAHGAGFCVFNDVAVAAADLLARSVVSRVLIFDCDVHQGDGTAEIFEHDGRVHTISLHGEKNYPAQKEKSDRDVPLPDGIEDEAYTKILHTELERSEGFAADIVFYNAGVDPHKDDLLGRLSLTDDGLFKRDKAVISHFLGRGLPVCGVIGGGYMKDHLAVASRHATLHRAAAHFA
jgi:acetoin utilization deacetylase AcuC-like enzyme